MYTKILVPVDGSETSDTGLLEAIKIAKELGSRICLLHIVNEFIFDYSYSTATFAIDVIDSMREKGKTVLGAAVSQAKKQGLQPETILLETIGGVAANLILQQAKEYQAELIVMGTHGRRGLRRLALGSDAEHVVRSAGIPVLLVRGGAAPKESTRGAVRQPSVAALA